MTTHSSAKKAGAPTWIELTTPDIDAARKFYHEVFGWDYDIGGPEFGGYTTARLGNRQTVGLMGDMPGAPAAPTAWNLYFASHDLESDVAHAVKLGAKVLNPPMAVAGFGSWATCADPGGAAFSLWKAGQHVGSQVTDEPGATTWHELYAPNAKQARDFYAAVLGATVDPMPGDMEYYVLKHGDKMICGIMQIDPSWGAFQSQWMTYFSVVDADKTAATVKKLGGKVMGIDDSPFGRIAALADPCGALFKVVQLPAS
jgi:uncharacterized protein